LGGKTTGGRFAGTNASNFFANKGGDYSWMMDYLRILKSKYLATSIFSSTKNI
jgi:hypothetical protein